MREQYLKQFCPGVFIAVLKELNSKWAQVKLQIYQVHYLQCEKSEENYTYCILGHLEPMICEFRAEGRLTYVEKQIEDRYGNKWDFKGEVDKKGLACGKGVATRPSGSKFEGTFLDGQWHGTGVRTWSEVRYEGEYRHGKDFGKGTYYGDDGQIINQTCDENGCKSDKDISCSPDDVFYKDGRPHMALMPNWMDFRGEDY